MYGFLVLIVSRSRMCRAPLPRGWHEHELHKLLETADLDCDGLIQFLPAASRLCLTASSERIPAKAHPRQIVSGGELDPVNPDRSIEKSRVGRRPCR